jgi:hypothetical protein
VYADETSWWVGGAGWWLWTFTNPHLTVYRAEDSRGSLVVKETLGEDFEGVLVSDCLASDDPMDYQKQKCIAHQLRAIAEAKVQLAEGQVSSYLLAWKYLFKEMLALYRATRVAGRGRVCRRAITDRGGGSSTLGRSGRASSRSGDP